MSIIVDLGAVVATKGRSVSLLKTLTSLAGQSYQPRTIVIVDASPDLATKEICGKGVSGISSEIRWIRAVEAGAAVQRNLGAELIEEDFIWFFDDDILFDANCTACMWRALQSATDIGGVNATIKNQGYGNPGFTSRLLFRLMDGEPRRTYAGRVLGPAINLLAEDSDDLPEVVPIQWLNTTCTIYRRKVLPSPPFNPFFRGYSMMEDLALSLEVGKAWKLVNARTARIFHDSQSDCKSNQIEMSCMELRNRHFVMTRVMDRRSMVNYVKLILWEVFSLISVAARPRRWGRLPAIVAGKASAILRIISGRN